ncbi:MAG: AMP-binding protein [Limnothrix sp.]
MLSTPTNLIDFVCHHSQIKKATDLAYIFLENGKTETATLTYKQLLEQVFGLAQYLQTFTKKGDRLLLVYPAGLDFVVAFLGCLAAGVIAVPVYPPRPNRPLERLTLIAEDTQAVALLSTTAMLAKLESKLQAADSLKSLKAIATDSLELTDSASERLDIEQEDIAFLQYTSGSTGQPKGVMVSHGNLLHNLQTIQTGFELTSESVSVSWLPHYHDMGLVDGILEPLYTGCLGVLMPPTAFLQQPIRWLEAITKYRGTHSGGPDVGYDLCCRKITPEQQAKLDLSGWLSAYNGAEPIRAATLEVFTEKFATSGFQAKYFYPCYGMAESTLMITGVSVAQKPTLLDVSAKDLEQNKVVLATTENSRQLVGCGQTRLETQVKIVDIDSLKPCDEDAIGEIWVTGGSIAQGYWHKPEATVEAFQAELDGTNFFRTGDLGFLHQGELFITGRLKDVVIIWGRNYYPQDLEFTVASCHPDLSPAGGAAFSITEASGEQLVIVQEIERTARRTLDVDEVVTTIREAIAAEYDLQVQAIALIKPGSIPKTSSGKIQRRLCRQQFIEGNLETLGTWQQSTQATPETTAQPMEEASDEPITAATIQAWLIQHIAAVLHLDQDEIEIDESFAQYGLDSSVMLEITGELGTWLHVELDSTLLWEYTDIESLTEYLVEEFIEN